MLSSNSVPTATSINPVIISSWLTLSLILEVDENVRAVHLHKCKVASGLLVIVMVSQPSVKVLHQGVDVISFAA